MPSKRRRYLYVEDDTSQLVTTDTEARIRQLEKEIINYKLQIRALEKSMTKCLSPVPSEYLLPEAMPVSLTKPLISAYEDAGRWACSHFDNKFEMLKQRTGSKETSWQLVTAYKSDYREVYITQCSSEGLVDILAWINVFLMGETLREQTIMREVLLKVAVDIVMALFYHRGAQLDRDLAQPLMSNLVLLSTYMKMNDMLAPYSSIVGFMFQLLQIHERKMDPSVLFSVQVGLLVSAPDHATRTKLYDSFYSQPEQPHTIDSIKFQLHYILCTLLFPDCIYEENLRVMVQNLRYIDDQLEAIKQTQWYYFFKIWVYAVEAEFALQLKDDKRYDFLMDEINRFDRLLPSELHRNRLAKIFKAVVMLGSSRNYNLLGSSFYVYNIRGLLDRVLLATNTNTNRG
jgi:hypothetical protein